MYPAFFSGTNCLNPSLFNSSLRIALLALYLKYVKTFLLLLYKIVTLEIKDHHKITRKLHERIP